VKRLEMKIGHTTEDLVPPEYDAIPIFWRSNFVNIIRLR
jgi:hypothetical protein